MTPQYLSFLHRCSFISFGKSYEAASLCLDHCSFRRGAFPLSMRLEAFVLIIETFIKNITPLKELS